MIRGGKVAYLFEEELSLQVQRMLFRSSLEIATILDP
jgi:hypothetical protein